jgi:predicted nuclease with TOPRIM domain
MTDKEKLELINLRNRLRSQREEIKRLMAENAELKKMVKRNEGDVT